MHNLHSVPITGKFDLPPINSSRPAKVKEVTPRGEVNPDICWVKPLECPPKIDYGGIQGLVQQVVACEQGADSLWVLKNNDYITCLSTVKATTKKGIVVACTDSLIHLKSHPLSGVNSTLSEVTAWEDWKKAAIGRDNLNFYYVSPKGIRQ